MQSRPPADPEFEALINHIQQSRGLDFRGYKRTSLRRRIQLRMEELHIDSFTAYQDFLEADPQEFVDLLNTVLINVTSFFRDTEAWDSLRKNVIPAILARHQGRESIRVWSVGCASGEEPYSIAMLLAEEMGMSEFCQRVKIYATDLDESALRTARHATYSPREVESVPPALLEKYFERTPNHYVFQRELRKCVIFGRHNVVFDAPISRIDLITCRNLLIYLETETQNVVLPRLNYALKDGAYLFLGKAETQLARSKFFEAVDTKHRIFRKRPQEWRKTQGGSIALTSDPADAEQVQQVRLLEGIIDAATTAHLVVDVLGTLVFANSAARRLLDVGEGDLGRPFQDLSISYRPTELRGRIEEAQREGRTVRIEHQEYHRPPGDPLRVTIDVVPLFGRDGKPYASLLAFSDTTRLYQLQQELEAAQESLETTIEELQSANEELETTNEELQSTNEELETTNEELQSTNEELETMNEELRSTNEELEAANEELRRQSEDSNSYRSHAESVLRSVNVGIIVLNNGGQVQSWNRWSENVWGLRAEEVVGQAFGSLDIGLPVRSLLEPIQKILDGSQSQADRMVEAIDRRGRNIQCQIRITPLLYDNRTPRGAVIIAEDVTEQRQHSDYTQYLGRIIGQSLNEVYFLDPETLRFSLVNRGAEEKLGYPASELEKMALHDLMPKVSKAALRLLVEPLLKKDQQEVVFETTIKGAAREYPAEICLQYFSNEQPPFLLAIVHDTTKRQALPKG